MKEQNDTFDDQILGTFIDGELDAANQEAILNAMEADPELRERVYRLRRARDLMRLGYGEARAPATGRRKATLPRWSFPTRMAASIAALAISFSAGMFGFQYLSTPASQPVLAGAAQQHADKVILHISQSSQRHFARALDYTEQFLRTQAGGGHEIEVVAHANGLDLLREDVSPLRKRIKILMQQYDNVHFVACAGAISLLRDSGIEPRIIPGVSTDTTAFDHIVTRLQGGDWRYIKAESLPGA